MMADEPERIDFGTLDLSKVCACGHDTEEHGGDPQYPGSSACQVSDCDCIAFESCDPESPPVNIS